MNSVILLLVACLRLSVGTSDFSNQVFKVTEHFSREDCKPTENDDCYSDILFLPNRVFMKIDRCADTNYYYKGTYLINGDHLNLNFKQIIIEEIQNNKTKDIRLEKKITKVIPAEFFITSCKGNEITLEQLRIKVLTKAFRRAPNDERKIIEEITNSKVWSMLN